MHLIHNWKAKLCLENGQLIFSNRRRGKVYEHNQIQLQKLENISSNRLIFLKKKKNDFPTQKDRIRRRYGRVDKVKVTEVFQKGARVNGLQKCRILQQHKCPLEIHGHTIKLI